MGRSALSKTEWQLHAPPYPARAPRRSAGAASPAKAKQAGSSAKLAQSAKKYHAPATPGFVRIIGGQWRRRQLPVASGPAAPAGLRPTADRVRETLFNWLGQDLSGWRCIDLCAGTGALGFEAASRGAARATLVEQHPAVVQHLHAMRKQLDAQTVQIVAGDGLQYLRRQAEQAPGSVDVLFFDPPYTGFSTQAYQEVLHWASVLLVADGRVYLESGREWTPEELAQLGWERWRYLKAGTVHAHLLRRLPQPTEQGVEA